MNKAGSLSEINSKKIYNRNLPISRINSFAWKQMDSTNHKRVAPSKEAFKIQRTNEGAKTNQFKNYGFKIKRTL